MIEVGGEIPFNDPEIFLMLLGAPRNTPNRIHGSACGTKTKGIWTKIRLKNGFEDHPQGFLYNSIPDGRYAQWALCTIGFRNVHPSDWGRCKRFRPQFFGDLLEVFFQLFVKEFHVHAIATRRHASCVLLHRVMRESEPLLFVKQTVKVTKPMFRGLCRLETKESLHFPDIHGDVFHHVSCGYSALDFPTNCRPSPCTPLSRARSTMTAPTPIRFTGGLLTSTYGPPTFMMMDSTRSLRWRFSQQPIPLFAVSRPTRG
jgi:hypothetical protein